MINIREERFNIHHPNLCTALRWKGQFITNQHTEFPDPFARPLFGGQEVASGFSGTFSGDEAEVFGTTLVGTRSLSFHATLKRLADI